MNAMKDTTPEPLNLQLSRLTPAWARPRAARRALVGLMYAGPLIGAVLIGLSPNDALRAAALLPMLLYPLCWAWLVGATQARADLSDDYLDEREVNLRDSAYLNAFRNLMAVISLLFVALTLLPVLVPGLNQWSASGLIGLLFAFGLPLPTACLAWIQPDPPAD